jgi:hypothetical protein
MELIMMSLGGSLVAFSLQLSELVFDIGRQLRSLGLKTTAIADTETVIPGF